MVISTAIFCNMRNNSTKIHLKLHINLKYPHIFIIILSLFSFAVQVSAPTTRHEKYKFIFYSYLKEETITGHYGFAGVTRVLDSL